MGSETIPVPVLDLDAELSKLAAATLARSEIASLIATDLQLHGTAMTYFDSAAYIEHIRLEALRQISGSEHRANVRSVRR